MGDPVKLASRCVQSYHWSETFALRAVNEYKRFMRLKSDAVREVELALLPSSCVELVWLLELQDTREYQLNRGTCGAAALPPVRACCLHLVLVLWGCRMRSGTNVYPPRCGCHLGRASGSTVCHDTRIVLAWLSFDSAAGHLAAHHVPIGVRFAPADTWSQAQPPEP